MGHLESLSTDMKEIVSDVKKGKGTFGSLLRDGELADEVKEAISSVNKFVSKVVVGIWTLNELRNLLIFFLYKKKYLLFLILFIF